MEILLHRIIQKEIRKLIIKQKNILNYHRLKKLIKFKRSLKKVKVKVIRSLIVKVKVRIVNIILIVI